MTRRAPHLDKFHGPVDLCLKLLGCSTQSLAGEGKGCPDILVGCCGVDFLLEIKTDGWKLEQDQVQWHRRWQGRRVITLWLMQDSTPDEIMEVCRSIVDSIKVERGCNA